MSDELEPYIPEIEPTRVIGPDDWRPYSEKPPCDDQILRDLNHARDALLYGARYVHNAEAGERVRFAYNPNGQAQYSDPQNVREPGIPDGRYRLPDGFLYGALRANETDLQRRIRARLEFGMRIHDPKNIIKGMGT